MVASWDLIEVIQNCGGVLADIVGAKRPSSRSGRPLLAVAVGPAGEVTSVKGRHHAPVRRPIRGG